MSYPLLSIVDLPACFWQERISSIRLHWVSAEITAERSCSATWDRTFRTQPAGTWRRWGHLLTETVVLRHKHTSLKWWSESGDDGIKEQKACQGEQSPLCASHRRRFPQPGKIKLYAKHFMHDPTDAIKWHKCGQSTDSVKKHGKNA